MKKKRINKCLKQYIIISVLVIFLFYPSGVYAVENDEEIPNYEETGKIAGEKMLTEFDFTMLDDRLNEIFPEEKMSFRQMVKNFIETKGEGSGKIIADFILDQINYEFRHNKKNLVYVLLLAVIAAIFTNFSNAFQNKQVSEIGFYVLYLLLLTLCLNSFKIAVEGVSEKLELILGFMQVLCPTYFLAVSITTGSASSIMFYNIVLFLIYLVEMLVLNFLIPLVNIYIMIQVINYLSGDDFLTQLSELIKNLVSWILKTLLTCVIGINVIQGMLAPAIDAVKRSAITKTAEAIPGVGKVFGGVTDMVLATAVLIRNGIGITGAGILLAICAVPIIQMFFMMFLYKTTAAIVQPVSDKRITSCISSVSEGYELLGKVIFVTVMLFLITIAILTVTTGLKG